VKCGWILTDLAGGGAERLPLLLAPAMEHTDLTVLLMKDRVRHRVPPGVRVVPFSKGRRSLAAVGPAVLARASLFARHVDVLVAGLEWAPTFFAAATAAAARRPLVATVHVDLRRYHEEEPVPDYWWRLMRWSLGRAAAIVTVSEDARESVLRLGVPGERTHLISNPVAPWEDGTGAASGQVRELVTVASLNPRKGIGVALEALARLPDLDVRWTFVGDGPEKAPLVEQAARLGVSERVRFTGFVEDPRPYLREADLFVLPSLVEAAPLALMEAMSASLPVVASRSSTTVVGHLEGAGELVPVGDAEALATGIRRLVLASPEERTRLGDAVRERMRPFAADVIADAYEQLFASIVARSAGACR
jgi:glycosyltransferase involved in cell wall biosynthesis